MIYFIGDKASKRHIDPTISFVGTNSYEVLLNWIHRMNLSINDIMIHNSNAFIHNIQRKINEDDQIIALGREADEILTQHNIPHYHMPYPSGKNLLVNDVKEMDKILRKCREYVLQR